MRRTMAKKPKKPKKPVYMKPAAPQEKYRPFHWPVAADVRVRIWDSVVLK